MKKILVGLLIILCLGVVVVNTTWFKNRVFGLITDRIEQATGMHITVGGFQYAFPLKFTLHNIALGSPEDPDLTIAEIYLHASVSALWRNEIKIHNLRIDNVIVHRAIQLPETSEQHTGSFEIPLPVNLTHFQINDLTLDPRLPPLNIEGNFEANGPHASGFVLAQLATLSLALDMNYEKANGLAVNIQEGRTGPLSFGGQLYLSPELTLDRTRFQVQLNNVKVLERWIPITLHGKLAATCQIEGPLLKPKASVDVTSKRLFVLGYAWENFKTSLNCQYEERSLTGSVNLASSGSDYRIQSMANFEWQFGKLLRLPTLSLEGPRTKFKGSFLADLLTGGIESQIEGATDDLVFLQEYLEDTVTGNISFKSNFAINQGGEQTMDLSLKGENLQIANLEAGHGEIDIQGFDLNRNPQLKVKARLKNFLWNALRLDEVYGETVIDTTQELWPYTINGNSRNKILNQFSTRGSWHKDPESILLALDELTGNLLDENIKLKEPVNIRLSPGFLNISPLALQFGAARLFATVDLSRHNFGSTIHVEDFPLEIITKLDPALPLSGKADAAFSLRGDPAQPEGKIEINLENIKIAENIFSKMPALRGSIKAELKDTQLTCSGELIGLEEQPIHIEAALPVHLSFYPLAINLKPEEELSAQFRIKGDVIPILQLFVSDTNTLRGETDIAIDISGTYSSPQVSGKAFLRNGTFESVKTGAVFKDIQAVIVAEGKEIQLKELVASDRFNGKLTGTGVMALDPQQHFPYHVDFNIDKSRFFNLDFADAVFTGTARLEGTTTEGFLSGKLNADRLAIVIPEQLPTAAHSVDVTFINTPKGQKQPIYHIKKGEWPLKLDLAVTVPKTTSINGTNLKTTWKGDLNIQGTSENPELHGELKIAKGSYLFNGKEFLINQGTITFAGDPEKKTSLYVIASHDLGKIIAEIILRGSIKNPTISFRSNPPLSQREILAWILFGRGVSDISATEGAQLNQSITNLKTSNKGPDMLTKIRNKMGIDRIDINRGDNEDANQVSVQVGKYISQGVYVSVNKSVTAESNQVCLEANLTKEIKVQAEVGDDQEGQLLLKWKKDY